MLEDVPEICILLDTFGYPCTRHGCEEFRTVGLEIAAQLGTDDEIRKLVVVTCREHLNEFFDEYIWSRKAIIVDEDEI